MPKKIILLLMMILSIDGFTEVLSFNRDGKPEGKHFIIDISKKQQREIGKTRYITLTTEQLKKIRSKNSKIPEKITVLTPNYEDCLCQHAIYAVWYKKEKIAIPVANVETYVKEEEGIDNSIDYGKPAVVKILIGAEGEFYYHGNEITEKELMKELKRLYKKHGEENIAFVVDYPPFDNKEIKKRIDKKILKPLDFCYKKYIKVVDTY